MCDVSLTLFVKRRMARTSSDIVVKKTLTQPKRRRARSSLFCAAHTGMGSFASLSVSAHTTSVDEEVINIMHSVYECLLRPQRLYFVCVLFILRSSSDNFRFKNSDHIYINT